MRKRFWRLAMMALVAGLALCLASPAMAGHKKRKAGAKKNVPTAVQASEKPASKETKPSGKAPAKPAAKGAKKHARTAPAAADDAPPPPRAAVLEDMTDESAAPEAKRLLLVGPYDAAGGLSPSSLDSLRKDFQAAWRRMRPRVRAVDVSPSDVTKAKAAFPGDKPCLSEACQERLEKALGVDQVISLHVTADGARRYRLTAVYDSTDRSPVEVSGAWSGAAAERLVAAKRLAYRLTLKLSRKQTPEHAEKVRHALSLTDEQLHDGF